MSITVCLYEFRASNDIGMFFLLYLVFPSCLYHHLIRGRVSDDDIYFRRFCFHSLIFA